MKHLFKGVFIATVILVFSSCSKNIPLPPEQNTASTVTNVEFEEELDLPVITEEIKKTRALTYIYNDPCGTNANKYNCVYYARCKKPSLPYGLTTWASKLAIINTQNVSVGAVAIISTNSPYGHVAYVTGKSGSGANAVITVRDGNWHAGYITQRTGTKAQLGIQGYFN